MVPGLGLNAERFGRTRSARAGRSPERFSARIHRTFDDSSYRRKKAPAITEASLKYGARSRTKRAAFWAHSLCEGGAQALSALARIHRTFDDSSYRTKKAPAYTEASLKLWCPVRNRTKDTRIFNPLLYQLS